MKQAVARHPAVNWVVVDDGVVAVDSRTADVHVLTGAAAIVWQLLDGSPLVGVADDIVAHFDIDRARADEDVDAALQLFIAAGLTEASGGR